MAIIAVYSMKGGVGKSCSAVNLAWQSAAVSSRKTLLWDLDPQGAASYILGKVAAKDQVRAMIEGKVNPKKLVRETGYNNLHLLAADASLRDMDRSFFELGKKKQLRKAIAPIASSYERIILDCPPGLTKTSEQVLRNADLIIVPIIPSPLSERAFLNVQSFLDKKRRKHAPMLPVFTMVDRRRKIHNETLSQHKKWPIIPMASDVERMTYLRKPLGEIAPHGVAADAYTKLWRGIERRLKKMGL